LRTLDSFKNPFQAILDFEAAVCAYTGAPYCVTTDCCTHAIEIAFRLAHDGGPVQFPARTYLSVPMTMRKLNIEYELLDIEWRGGYKFEGSCIYDYARKFEMGMYVPGTIQCISFGMTKPIQIGLGGCLITDDANVYKEASKMRYDGRDIFNFSPWSEQKVFRVGYHYYLRPEECVVGLNLLESQQFTLQQDKFYNYPDCRNIIIND
jgi:dTDP-4-amino-4,6-dideoxygalactose transaminase